MKPASSLPRSGPARYIPVEQSGLPVPRVMLVEDGAVLEDVDCTDCYVSVQANRVEMRGCRFTAVQGLAIIVDLYPKCGKLIVERCHFDGMKRNVATDTMLRARDGEMFVRDCLFENLPNDAVNSVGGSVERCTFAGAGYLTGGHSDAITVNRTVAPVLIMDNNIDYSRRADAATPTTSVITVAPGTGAINDVLIEKNIIRGGAYSFYIYQAPKAFTMENVIVRDNLVGDWLFGASYPKFRYAGLVWQGNRHLKTNAPLTVDAR